MNCPDCHTDLVELPTTESAQVDACPNGHGLWLDAGEINFFIENYSKFRTTSPRNGAVAVAAETAACPRCGVRMTAETLSDVPYLSCASCNGWWLAQGILTRLNEAFRGGTVPIRLNESTLFARAAARSSIPGAGHPRTEYVSTSNSGALFFWIFVFGFALVLSGLIAAEGARMLASNAHLAAAPDRLFLYIIAGMAGGSALFIYGFILNRRKRLIERTPTSTIRSLAVGLVEVNGQAEADGDSLVSPFSGMNCVFFTYKVEERRGTGKNTRWVTIAEGASGLPFYVRDETGRVLIVPTDARIKPIVQHTVSSGFLGSLPPEAISGLNRLGISTGTLLGDKPFRCHESLILPKETVYVLGTAQENPAADSDAINAGRLYIGKGTGGDFIISGRSEKDLLRQLRWQVFGSLYGGPALTLGSLLLLLRLYVRI